MAQHRQSGGFFDFRGGAHHPLPDYRIHPSKPSRIRRPAKPPSSSILLGRRRSPALAAALLVAAVFLLSRRLSHHPTEISQDLGGGEAVPEWNGTKNGKELRFGHGGGGRSARDSRYWDRDDRRRDEDYSEDEKERVSGGAGVNAGDDGRSEKGVTLEIGGGENEVTEVAGGGKRGALYNEGGRKELEEYEAAVTGRREVDPDDEYDDGIDAQDDFDDAQMHSFESGRKLGDGGNGSTAQKENTILETRVEPAGGTDDGGGTGNMNQKKVSGNDDKKHGSKKKPKRKKSGAFFFFKI